MTTVGTDGTPHAVPVEVVVDRGRVYVWCHATSVKARNAGRAGRAALVGYKGHAFVLVRGAARLLTAADNVTARIAKIFLDKYEREETYGNDTLIEIEPERISSDRIG